MNITKNTTLNELINGLGYLEKAEKRPTARALRETAGDPVAAVDGCQVYANGYAVYTNGSGTTVLWLKDCLNFTYYFVQPKDGEKESITGKAVLDEDALGAQPWYIGVMLRGDHRVEENSMHRTGERNNVTSRDTDAEETDADKASREQRMAWRSGGCFESPEAAFIRKEFVEEQLARLTDIQREAYILYHWVGLNQEEIAKKLNVAQRTVSYHLKRAALQLSSRVKDMLF